MLTAKAVGTRQMVRLVTPFMPPAPAGWSEIADKVEQLNHELDETVNLPVVNVAPHEVGWPVHQADWRRSRFVYRLWSKKKISRTLYEWLLYMDYANKDLCELWARPGYEFACCVHCALAANVDGHVCKCRSTAVKDDESFRCTFCGCQGCCT